MRIRRLKLTGFKSFVEPADLVIQPGLTGVVGPNGCGKSNVLEAIRWVMGESSPKSMRGGGMEDVIFAGTATRPARDFAEVTLLVERHPEETGGDTAFSGDIEVTRRIERGAGSAYRINGRDVRAKDVALLFADAATGAHSPALVSQGKIAQVIAAKPAERRMMLEEAAGIAGLHVRRKDAEQKLRAAEANLTRLDDLLGDMEQRAGQLKRQARSAERYRRLTDQIRIAEARLLFARWREAEGAATAARADAKAAETAVADAAEAQRAAAAWQSEAARTLGDLRARSLEARETASDLGHRLAAARAEQEGLARRLRDVESRRVSLAADQLRESGLAEDATAAIARLGAELDAIAARLDAAEARRGTIDLATVEAEDTARDAEAALAKVRARDAAEQAEARVARAARDAAAARHARAEADHDRVAAEQAALGDVAPLVAERQAAAATAAEARKAGEQAAAALAAGEQARDAAASRRDAAESTGSAARAALAALEAEAGALEKALATAGGDKVIDRIRAAPGYERALAAALGDDLDAALDTDAPRRWTGAAPLASDPALPDGLSPLAGFVEAPPALARRLAQIGVADSDDGTPLAVGQRLVTRAGALRRWDGYVATNLGAAAAERLIRANRLAEIGAALPAARAAVEAAEAESAAASAALDAARAAIAAARTAQSEAEGAARRAALAEDAAALAIERLEVRRAALADRLTRAVEDRAEAQAARAAAEAALAALPDAAQTAAELHALGQSAEAAAAALADIRAEAATLARAAGADRQRAEAARAERADWEARAGAAAQRGADLLRRIAETEREAETLAEAPVTLAARIAALETDARAAGETAAAAAAHERAGEEALRDTEARAAEAGEALAAAREARAGALARAENAESRRTELGRIAGERFECPAPVLPERLGFDSSALAPIAEESATLERLTAERERIGPVNLVAERELAELEEGRTTSQAEREELGLAIQRLRGSIGSLNREGRARLLAAFEAVDRHFRSLFTTLFNGGQAHLALVDSDDPLEAGLEIMAEPPGKRLSSLTLLSGGEQALTAVALIFALFLTNPAPICVLDEVDAPLDDANIERFCDLLDRMTRETDTRYLIVTHNAVTMSRMHRLFGVTMIEQGVSRLVSVDLGGATGLLAAE